MSLSRHRRLRGLTGVAVLVLPLGLAAVGAAPAAAASATVVIQGYAFAPANLTVNVGDTITWTNKDGAAHDVTSAGPSGPLHSPRMATGQTYTASFASAGTFRYVCTIHPDMTATVVVRATAVSTTDVGTTATSTTAVAPPPTATVPASPSTSISVAVPVTGAAVSAVALSSGPPRPRISPLLFLAAAVAAVVVGGTIAVLEPRRRRP